MYMNLKAEMARKGITNEQLANGIGINPATMSAKLNIAGRMRLDEAQYLRDKFFPGMTMDYLFGDVRPADPPKSARGRRKDVCKSGGGAEEASLQPAGAGGVHWNLGKLDE